MALGESACGVARRRLSGLHQLRERPLDPPDLLVDIPPLVRAVARRPAPRLAVGLGMPPALARLVFILGRIEPVEHSRLLLRLAGAVRGEGRVERVRKPGEPLELAFDQAPLSLERAESVVAILVEQRADLIECEAERPPREDLLQALQILV